MAEGPADGADGPPAELPPTQPALWDGGASPAPARRVGGSARKRTLLVAGVGGVILFVVALLQTVDYVALGPGEADNTLGSKDGRQIIAVSGAAQATSQTYPGKLLLTTVSVGPKLTLGQALLRWIQPSYAVVPNEVVNPPSQTTQQTNRQNAQDMTQSQDDATTAALDLLGKPEDVAVGSFEGSSKAAGKLAVGDILKTVDGKAVTGYNSLRQLVSGVKVGQDITVTATRKGKPVTATFATIDGGGRAIIGIIPAVTSPIKVTITNQNVGGPSAGMMYALGIIQKLSTPIDALTGSRTIAGTGTIDSLGDVGDIGGIQEKLRGAKREGATVFLVPAGNCAEAAAAHVGGLQLVKIPDTAPASLSAPSNLATAYADLKSLAAGNTNLPRC